MTVRNRNKIYEDKLKEKGLKKITIWVPEESAVDFKAMSEYCCRNRETSPFMVRNHKTGRMAKGV